jgi:hypothetical protein
VGHHVLPLAVVNWYAGAWRVRRSKVIHRQSTPPDGDNAWPRTEVYGLYIEIEILNGRQDVCVCPRVNHVLSSAVIIYHRMTLSDDRVRHTWKDSEVGGRGIFFGRIRMVGRRKTTKTFTYVIRCYKHDWRVFPEYRSETMPLGTNCSVGLSCFETKCKCVLLQFQVHIFFGSILFDSLCFSRWITQGRRKG